ncbi:MAG: hypothetical protein GF347_03215 [Candidatus Moranbacteria bacterium]|nr:hypothetical protein [Candidatus Moranbacteria bacterium]
MKIFVIMREDMVLKKKFRAKNWKFLPVVLLLFCLSACQVEKNEASKPLEEEKIDLKNSHETDELDIENKTLINSRSITRNNGGKVNFLKNFDYPKLEQIYELSKKENLDKSEIEYLKDCSDYYKGFCFLVLYDQTSLWYNNLVKELKIEQKEFVEVKSNTISALGLLNYANKINREYPKVNSVVSNYILYMEFKNMDLWTQKEGEDELIYLEEYFRDDFIESFYFDKMQGIEDQDSEDGLRKEANALIENL